MTVIQAVVFDFGNVLASFDHMKICRRLSLSCNYSADHVHKAIFQSGLEREFDLGNITQEYFYDQVITALGIDPKNITLFKFSGIWNSMFSENKAIVRVIERINPGIKKIILSNTNNMHWEMRIKNMPVMKDFFPDPNQWVLSFQVRARKPEENIYREAIKRLDVEPLSIVYIDDIPVNVAAFERFGARGVVYNCQKDPIEKLKEKLAELDLLI
ncbi:HAD-IA family hydrolase [Candidatus Azambacteria bacterium]|nr:HAD-IA family hydrolase [Candidatus Azambacteria bacterium]